MRLDQFVSVVIPDCSRSLVAASIRKGIVTVDGEVKKNSYRLKGSEVVTGCIDLQPDPLNVEPEQIDFPILYEDEFLIVISKPPGLVVHPGAGNRNGTLVSGLVHHCDRIAGVGDAARPGIVHRLDKDTSGAMLVAKNDFTHRSLVESFKKHEISKTYLAIVHGIMQEDQGRLVAALGRHPVHRQKMAIREESGKHAATSWKVLATFGSRYSFLKVDIETGRTHQIRVHLAHLGHPIAGDTVYGPGRNNSGFERQMLHAFLLRFKHPVGGDMYSYEAPLWPDMNRHVEDFGWLGAV